MPRILGYAFNPLSVYFCHRADGALQAILYEVNNTFGERHSYLIPVDAAQREGTQHRAALRQALPCLALSRPRHALRLSRRAAGADRDGLRIGVTAQRRAGRGAASRASMRRRRPLDDAGAGCASSSPIRCSR